MHDTQARHVKLQTMFQLVESEVISSETAAEELMMPEEDFIMIMLDEGYIHPAYKEDI